MTDLQNTDDSLRESEAEMLDLLAQQSAQISSLQQEIQQKSLNEQESNSQIAQLQEVIQQQQSELTRQKSLIEKLKPLAASVSKNVDREKQLKEKQRQQEISEKRLLAEEERIAAEMTSVQNSKDAAQKALVKVEAIQRFRNSTFAVFGLLIGALGICAAGMIVFNLAAFPQQQQGTMKWLYNLFVGHFVSFFDWTRTQWVGIGHWWSAVKFPEVAPVAAFLYDGFFWILFCAGHLFLLGWIIFIAGNIGGGKYRPITEAPYQSRLFNWLVCILAVFALYCVFLALSTNNVKLPFNDYRACWGISSLIFWLAFMGVQRHRRSEF